MGQPKRRQARSDAQFRDALLANVSVLWRARDADDNVRPPPLVEASNDDRQAPRPTPLFALLLGIHRADEPVPERVDEPERQARERRGIDEEGEVGSLGDGRESEPLERGNLALVDERRALADDGLLQGHAER